MGGYSGYIGFKTYGFQPNSSQRKVGTNRAELAAKENAPTAKDNAPTNELSMHRQERIVRFRTQPGTKLT